MSSWPGNVPAVQRQVWEQGSSCTKAQAARAETHYQPLEPARVQAYYYSPVGMYLQPQSQTCLQPQTEEVGMRN